MNKKDKNRLLDMLAEAKRAQRFVSGKSLDDLRNNDMAAYAIVRCLEIIGEAASTITGETRRLYPQIEWRKMIGMRNRIVHDYGNIDYSIVWNTVEDILPTLIRDIQQIISSDKQEI